MALLASPLSLARGTDIPCHHEELREHLAPYTSLPEKIGPSLQRTHVGFQALNQPQHTASSGPRSHQYPPPPQQSNQSQYPVLPQQPQHGLVDPAIGGQPPLGAFTARQSPSGSGGDEPNSKGGKRELSSSKRAAQNRQAQRAFRQRKEVHIKKLEDQVKDHEITLEQLHAVQAENFQLREYIITLQSRLIETQTEMPPAPENVDLTNRPVYEDHGTSRRAADGEGRRHDVRSQDVDMQMDNEAAQYGPRDVRDVEQAEGRPEPLMRPSEISQLQESAQRAVEANGAYQQESEIKLGAN